MKKHGFYLLLLALMYSCQPKTEQAKESISAENIETEQVNEPEIPDSGIETPIVKIENTPKLVQEPIMRAAANQAVELKGLLCVRNDSAFIRSCQHPDEVYFAGKNNQQLMTLYKQKRPKLSFPGESVFIHLKGTGQPDSPEMDRKYAGAIQVKEVLGGKQKNYRNSDVPFEYWGFGNEPFWHLEISKAENCMVFKSIGDNQIFAFPYKEPGTEDQRTLYRQDLTLTGDSKEIEVVVSKEDCSDGMSDNSYEYKMEVKIGGKTYRGCASKGR